MIDIFSALPDAGAFVAMGVWLAIVFASLSLGASARLGGSAVIALVALMAVADVTV